jgi:hypothetical protein
MPSADDERLLIPCITDGCRKFKKGFEIKLGQLSAGHPYHCSKCGAKLTFKSSDVFAYKHAVAEREKAQIKVQKALGNLVGSASIVPKH